MKGGGLKDSRVGPRTAVNTYDFRSSVFLPVYQSIIKKNGSGSLAVGFVSKSLDELNKLKNTVPGSAGVSDPRTPSSRHHY